MMHVPFLITIIVSSLLLYYVQGDNFGEKSNNLLQGVSLKVLKLMLEQKSTLNIVGYSYVCDRVTWNRGAYGSHYLKSSSEDQVFGYDVLALLETF